MMNETEISKRIEKLEIEIAGDQRKHAEAERNITFLKSQMELLVGQMNFKNGAVSALKEMLEPEKKEVKNGNNNA